MSKFKAKNNVTKVNHLFYRRLKYKLEMGQEATEKAQEVIRDFTFSDYSSYGKVNQTHEPMIPKPNLLLNYQFNSKQSTPIPLIEFVADQLNDLLDNVSKRILVGRVTKGSFLNSLIPVAGYVDPVVEYEKYMETHLLNFHQNFLKIHKDQVMNFDDYLESFYIYLHKLAPEFPCTLTGWYKSKQASPYCSGLYVDLDKISKHVDGEKEKFILDKNFPHYLNVCKQYGFHVSKNNPNTIVSDLASPATVKYLNKYRIPRWQSVHKLYYIKTSEFDLSLLMEFLVKKYYQFINDNPDNRSFHFGRNGHMISKLTKRKYINNIDLYTNKYIIYYIKIRNIEEDHYFNEADLQEVIENSIFLLKRLDIEQVMSYINLHFAKNTASKEGSVDWFRKRLEEQ